MDLKNIIDELKNYPPIDQNYDDGKIENHYHIVNLIEGALRIIGGDGWDGVTYTREVLEIAGLKNGLGNFTTRRNQTIAVYEKLRTVLIDTQDRAEIIQRMQ
jgi:hypothetical protein